MTINIISCVTNYKNNLAIGKDGDLLFKLPEDMRLFKTITTNSFYKESLLNRNVVLMGRKTWFSIPREQRPLKNRLNLVLTKDIDLLRLAPYPSNNNFFNTKSLFDFTDKNAKDKNEKDKNEKDKKNINDRFCNNLYFITLDQFLDFYKVTNSNVFVIGGSAIYDLFLNPSSTSSCSNNLLPNKIYLTEVQLNEVKDKFLEPDTFMSHLDQSYKLISVSEKHKNDDLSFRFLEYKRYNNYETDEKLYLNSLRCILEHGNSRDDRTGVGTISIFGHQINFDISQSIPLLTTKKIPWKHCIEELLWFMRGDTDAKILQKQGVKIWDGNTSREFLDNRGLQHYEEGILGPGYGWQWRRFGGKYSQAFADTSKIDISKVDGFDQLEYIIHELKTNPFSRRIMMSYWNPPDFKKTALLPCHFSCQFYVTEKANNKYLSCMFNMRSNDMFLGNPFNIFSYAVLTYIIAKRCDMIPDRLIYNVGDMHIYKNHLEQIGKQLTRDVRPFPKLLLNPNIKTKPINQITIDDFDIVGYFPHPPIRAPMAI